MTDILASPPTLIPDDMPAMKVAFGGSMRATEEEGVIEGYLITFTGPEQKDLYKTYFNAKTNYYRSAESMINMPVLYHHGLDPVIGVNPIGRCVAARFDEKGLWIRAKLYTSNTPDDEVTRWLSDQRQLRAEYIDAVMEMAKNGELGWSSGALPQSVKSAADDGWISDWMPVEGSPTPSEAMPWTNTVMTGRSYLNALTGRIGDKEEIDNAAADQPTPAVPATPQDVITPIDDTPQKDTPLMDAVAELKQMLQDILNYLMESGKVAEVEAPVAMAALEDEIKAVPEEEQKALVDDGTGEAGKSFIIQRLVARAVGDVLAKRAAKNSLLKGATDAATKQMQNSPAVSRTAPVGAVTRVEQVRDNRFDYVSTRDMITGVMVRTAERPLRDRARLTLEDLGFSEGFIRAFKHKIGDTYLKETPFKDPADTNHVRSAIPFRANEVDSTTNTGFGPEWVAQIWSAQIWDRARNETGLLETMLRKGMHEYTLGKGAGTFNVPTEGSDPTVYTLTQINDVDATGRPSVVGKVSPFATGNVAVTPKGLIATSTYTNFLDEDSALAVLPQLTRQLELAMAEAIESAMINGDTTPTINTNINLIDGTPGTGTSTPYYINNDGILKYPLVTNTAMSRDANNTFGISDFLETWKLFDPQYGSRVNNLLWLMDHFTYMAALSFPEVATDDVRKAGATITSGALPFVYGIENYRSGFMQKANTAGKISATPGNNLYGRLSLVYAPYWALVRHREVTLEDFYNPFEQARSMIITTRFGFVARGAQASAISYELALS